MQKPPQTLGLRHVALFVENLEDCLAFYTNCLDMVIEWQPDDDNIYLTSAGQDNLALHRWQGKATKGAQKLDHIGFILPTIASVDQWHDFMLAQGVSIQAAPRTHRDGARSFYCFDPANTLVQMIYHPPISG